MEFTLLFLTVFMTTLWLAGPLLLFFITLISVLGLIVGRLEKWTAFVSIYYAFITATTVGYGDFRPTQTISRVLAVIIAFCGLAFTGIIVALAVNSAHITIDQTRDIGKVKATLEHIIEHD